MWCWGVHRELDQASLRKGNPLGKQRTSKWGAARHTKVSGSTGSSKYRVQGQPRALVSRTNWEASGLECGSE